MKHSPSKLGVSFYVFGCRCSCLHCHRPYVVAALASLDNFSLYVKLFNLLLSKSLKIGNKAKNKNCSSIIGENTDTNHFSHYSHLSSLCLLLLFLFMVGNKANTIGKRDILKLKHLLKNVLLMYLNGCLQKTSWWIPFLQ